MKKVALIALVSISSLCGMDSSPVDPSIVINNKSSEQITITTIRNNKSKLPPLPRSGSIFSQRTKVVKRRNLKSIRLTRPAKPNGTVFLKQTLDTIGTITVTDKTIELTEL